MAYGLQYFPRSNYSDALLALDERVGDASAIYSTGYGRTAEHKCSEACDFTPTVEVQPSPEVLRIAARLRREARRLDPNGY